jgi:hypothetical protein
VQNLSDETETVAMEVADPNTTHAQLVVVSMALPVRRSGLSTEKRPQEEARILQASIHPATKPFIPSKKYSPLAPIKVAVPTRENVEAVAKADVASFTVHDHYGVVPPPREIPISALYHLIREPEEGIVDQNLLEDASAYVSELGKVYIGHVGLRLRIEKAFFSWFSDISHQVRMLLQLTGFRIQCFAFRFYRKILTAVLVIWYCAV